MIGVEQNYQKPTLEQLLIHMEEDNDNENWQPDRSQMSSMLTLIRMYRTNMSGKNLLNIIKKLYKVEKS